MTLIYRDMRRQDLDAVIVLQQAISLYQPNVKEIERNWASYIGQGGIFALVAELDGEVVGFASMLLEHKLRGGIVGHIEDVVVASRHEAKGIGRGLVKELIFRGKHCYKFTLCCEEKNIEFYRKIGFQLGHFEMKLFPG